MSDGSDSRFISLSIRLLRKGRTVRDALREDHELVETAAGAGTPFCWASSGCAAHMGAVYL
jgi:hypothetical protein